MSIEVKQRKVVPDRSGYGHRGKQASLAMDEAGYRAWGFGDTQKEADEAAFDAVFKLRQRFLKEKA